MLKPQNAFSPQRRPGRRRVVDSLALLILAAYAWLAWSAEGAAPGGPALDPVWQAARQRGSLRIAIDVGFRPFADMRNGELVGYDVDLARAVAAHLGLGVEFVPTGYDALYDALTSGRADMIASALPYAPDQGYRARFSSFYFDAGQILVSRAESPIAGPADLAGRRVGVALGSDADSLARRLAASTPAIELRTSYDEPAQVLAALRAGALDAAIVDNVAALAAIQSAPGLRSVTALSSEPYVLAMPAASFQLQTEVNRALAALQAEGFMEQLNQTWFR